MAQARLLRAALLLLAVGQLSDAAPTEAEVFWRTVLPDSPLPEAILKLLHSAGTSFVNKPKETEADGFSFSRGPFYYRRYGAHKHSSRRTSGGDSTLSRSPFLYNYSPHEQSSLKPSGRGDSTGWLSRSPFLYYYSRLHKRSSLTPSDGDSTGWLLKFFISYASPEHSLPRPSGDDAMEEAFRWLFFHEQAVQVGKNMTLFFPQAATAPLGLLPRHVADSIPFSTASLSGVLARFGIAMGSVQAASMEETLHMCELPPAAGEAKFCATSLEALVEDAMAALGTRNIRPVTSDLPHSGAPLQTYTIRGVRPVDGSSFVSCHDDNYYPYTVYTCHDTGSTRAYMVEMEGARTGVVVTVAAICHTDTSHWDPEHVSFKLLVTKPGGTPVCHYLPYGHMIWVSMANHSSS